jgi:oxepin-CoA hydrolase / 3-oxo-5,6-dehydrosuberyl-CoA semialdehyde dehydrogenase
VPFDVNDEHLRSSFLTELLSRAIEPLQAAGQPSWGRMSAQQMLEHLEWAFDLSTGNRRIPCALPEAQRARMKVFLHNNAPSPHEFMNPALVAGLPSLRHSTIDLAKEALDIARRGFVDLASSPDVPLYTHPIFGPLAHGEWARTHFKHAFHHLQQFGLIVTA